MAGSTRLKGNALALKFGSPATDYWCDATSVVLDNEEADSDTVTFCDAAAGGGRQFFLTINAIQSLQSSSFWRYTWANTGAEVPFTYAPAGNTTPSADQPHFTGTVKIGPKPTVGGEAGPSSTYKFETRWDVVGDPVLTTGSPVVPVITSVLPAGKTGGAMVVITGTDFTGVTAVKFAAANATDFNVISATTIAAVVPTGTGVKAVTVVNSAGTSNAVNYTVA